VTGVFRGKDTNKVDSKGRVSVPASFRRVLEANDPSWVSGQSPSLVIHYGTARKNYLECYSMSAAADVDARIGALPRGSRQRRAMEDYFHASSVPASIDDTGRLVLSKDLRDMIGVTGEALFVAAYDTFKIWNPETYQQQEKPQTDAIFDDLPDDVDPLTMLDGGEV
jgi:MraZ protein